MRATLVNNSGDKSSKGIVGNNKAEHQDNHARKHIILPRSFFAYLSDNHETSFHNPMTA